MLLKHNKKGCTKRTFMIWYIIVKIVKKASKRLEALQSHYIIKHEGVRYTCNQCEHKSTQKYYLKIHQLTAHGGRRLEILFATNVLSKLYGMTV